MRVIFVRGFVSNLVAVAHIVHAVDLSAYYKLLIELRCDTTVCG